jgi:hypothetical protein
MGQAIRRSDHQLAEILDDDGVWTIYGHHDNILGAAINLRRALARAENRGQHVVAISRIIPDRIFIFSDQISRLTHRRGRAHASMGGG